MVGAQSHMGLQRPQLSPREPVSNAASHLTPQPHPDGRTPAPIGTPDDALLVEVDVSPMTDITDERSPEDYTAADTMLAEAPDPNPNPNPNPNP